VLPTVVTKTLSRQATKERNPKSEYRNPKQTPRQINLKSAKSKTPNPKEARLEFDLFWSFEIVSNFGFRASNFLLLAPLRETRLFRLLLHSKNRQSKIIL